MEKEMKIKIVPQVFMATEGIRRSYGVIIDNKPRYVFETEEELKAFLRGVKNG